VNRQIGERPAFLQRLIRTDPRGAIKRAHGQTLGPLERLELAFDDKVVFQKIRARFGGRLKYAISGSATLGRDVAEFVDALGIAVYEGYGLTETSPIVTANYPGARKLGSVGRVLPGVRVEIDTSVGSDGREGEIIVYGPNVMQGYHHRDAETREAFAPDGGLRTGDLGYFDEEGFLYVSGRIKEQYKLQNGKYVMPSPVEELYKLSPFIANIMIYGDNRAANVALVVPDEAAVRAWAKEREIELGEDLGRDARVRDLITGELERQGTELRGYEKPVDFALIGEDFTVDNGLLTPTLKLKRREIVSRYRAVLDGLGTKLPVAESSRPSPRPTA
jgi:long-chain acyl-CoA synthetase